MARCEAPEGDDDCMPRYSLQGLWWVPWIVLLEYWALWLRGARLPRLHENVLSLVHGCLYEFTKFLVRGLELGVYSWVWRRWALLRAPEGPFLGPALLVVLADFAYYWLHRASHEVSLLWSVHQVHHSSPDLTASVGVRHSPLQRLFAWPFALPFALLGFPPAHALAAAHFVLLYQVWLHTDALGALGPLEALINTPSHHRVHHAANVRYLDRNYGGVFIIWDRLFGTFQPELPEEKAVYGILQQPQKFDPMYNQVFYGKNVLKKALEVRASKGWREALCTLIKGPSWRPGAPWTGWDEDKIDVSRTQRLFREPEASAATHCYAILHFVASLALTSHLLEGPSEGPLEATFYSAAVMAGLNAVGILYDRPRHARLLEAGRCGLGLVLVLVLCFADSSFSSSSSISSSSYLLRLFLLGLYASSLAAWFLSPERILPPPKEA